MPYGADCTRSATRSATAVTFGLMSGTLYRIEPGLSRRRLELLVEGGEFDETAGA
jgi:hypothetical protein